MPKDEKKTFRQSGVLVIHESRDPRVYNVKRGCTYSQGDSYKFLFFFFHFLLTDRGLFFMTFFFPHFEIEIEIFCVIFEAYVLQEFVTLLHI